MKYVEFNRSARLVCAILAAALAVAGCDGDKKSKDGGEAPSGEAKPAGESEPAAKAPLEVVQIAAHNGTAMALMSDGTVRAWGSNIYKQLGREDDVNGDVATPIQVEGVSDAEALFAGGSNLAFTACVRKKGGEVACWGQADLIPGVTKHTAKPVAVPALKGAKKIAFGGGHACAIMPDDALACWGYNAFGSVGTGKAKDKRIKEPTKLAGLTDMIDVGAGNNHACGLHKDGTVSCWGYNSSKQVDPDNSAREVYEPHKVKGIEGATVLGLGYDVSCVVDGDGKARCWGDNFYNKHKQPIDGSEGTRAFSSNYSQHTCLIKDGGDVYCWGDNAYGQAGHDPAKEGNLNGEPTKVEGVSGAIAVATGYVYPSTCAATRDGVKCWGMNRFGGLGDGKLIDRHAPAPVEGVTADALPEPKDGFDAIETRGAATSFDELPGGCKKPSKLAAKLSKLPAIKEIPVVFARAKKKERKRDDDKMGTYYEVELRSYPFDPELSVFKVDQRPRGNQSKITLYFERYEAKLEKKGDKEKTVKTALDVDEGAYMFGNQFAELTGAVPEADRRVLGTRGGGAVKVRATSALFSGLFTAREGAEITHVGDDWICGELKLKNKDGSETLTGSFAAPVIARK